jgi:hypothetical protein
VSPDAAEAANQRQAITEEATDVAKLILQHLVDGFGAGEMPFEAFCRQCAAVLKPEAIEPYMRQKLLGACVEAALSLPAPLNPRGRGNKRRASWLAPMCAHLVEMVQQREGLKIKPSRSGERTAFERTAEILRERGVSWVTPITVAKARETWLASTEIQNSVED